MTRRARALTRFSAAFAAVAAFGAVAAIDVAGMTVAALPAGAAPASSEGACPTADGVTVVVDFQELGGGVIVRCAPGPSASGLDALARAGIAAQTTIRFPGFVCRIGGVPSSDPCIDTSPANAHWSYWIAQRGGSWCLSNHGAGARIPGPGAVEGWSFSLNRTQATAPAPRTAVPSAVAGAAPLGGGACSSASTTATTTTPKPTTPKPTAPPTAAAPPAAAPASGPVDGAAGPGASVARSSDANASRSRGTAGAGGTPPVSDVSAVDAGAASDTPIEVQALAEVAESRGDLDDASSDATAPPDAFDALDGEDEGGDEGGDDGEDRDVAVSLDGGSGVGGTGGGEGSPVGVIAAGSLIGAGSLVAAVMRKRGRAS